MYEIGSTTIQMTTKFVMTLSEMKEGDSFTITSFYKADKPVIPEFDPDNPFGDFVEPEFDPETGEEIVVEEVSTPVEKTLTVQEVNDIISIWDDTEKVDIINRFRYQEDLNDGFGKVSLTFRKCEEVVFDSNGVEESKNIEYIITVKAIEDIAANSILRL